MFVVPSNQIFCVPSVIQILICIAHWILSINCIIVFSFQLMLLGFILWKKS